MGNMTQNDHITVKEAVEITGRSKSSIHRDIETGKLTVLFKAPGSTGLILLSRDDVLEAYRER